MKEGRHSPICWDRPDEIDLVGCRHSMFESSGRRMVWDVHTVKSSHRGKAFFIVGPTCSGKTDVAQRIAERGGFDILSADSMTVYKDMNIGTAKPDPAGRAGVRYWGVDLVRVTEPFSAGIYREAALAAMASAASSGRDLIVAGGTGLYIKVLIDGLRAAAPADAEIRMKAQRMLGDKGVDALAAWLKAENNALLESLPDKRNPRRLIRALERSRAGGEPEGACWGRAKEGPRIPGLLFPPEQMKKRIERRAQRMFSAGLIEEVERLIDQGFDSAPTARHAIGYAEAVDCLRGKCSLEEAVEKTVLRTRQLVKRQNSWFRNQANVHWIQCDDSMPVSRIAGMVLEYWRSTGPTPIML